MVDLVAALTLALLLLDLVGVVCVAPPAVEGLHHLHDLGVELDILCLLVPQHDWVDEVEVQDGDHLVLRGLEERMLDVAVHDVDLLLLGRAVAEAVGVCLERAGQLAALATKAGADPEIGQLVHLLSWDEPLLRDEVCALGPLLVSLRDIRAQHLDLLHRRLHVPQVRRSEGQLLEEDGIGELLEGVVRCAQVERDAHVRVVVVRVADNVFDGRDVEGHHYAVDGQQHRLILLVHRDEQVAHQWHVV
mmetsp:Transcript_23965/g.71140  ORF Transcript_23965/g.71140 Transcript_23965/m.71140 type:complete len:247 (-) Transcript_23965:149-889(-)